MEPQVLDHQRAIDKLRACLLLLCEELQTVAVLDCHVLPDREIHSGSEHHLNNH